MMTIIIIVVLLSLILLGVEGYNRPVNMIKNKMRSMKLLNNNDDNIQPMSIRSSLSKPLVATLGYVAIIGGVIGSNAITSSIARAKTGGMYPVTGDEGIMSAKAHGTSASPVQQKLRWKCDTRTADRICNYNRDYAEYSGYWTSETSFLKENDGSTPVTFYDSVTGVALFKAPVGRTWNEFVDESKVHGWPSFRDSEVVWDNVRSLSDGEMVSITGTHLGHNLPDFSGNRYCINLVSVAGFPKETA